MNENDLRDAFAMFAMCGMIIREGQAQFRAENAWELADEMLKERNKVEEGIVAVKPKRKTK